MKGERSKLPPSRSANERRAVSSGLAHSRFRRQARSTTKLPLKQDIQSLRRGQKSMEQFIFFTIGQNLRESLSPNTKNAFHVLMTDRRTHPAAVVELTNSYHDIDASRLIILPVESLDAKTVRDVVRRVKRAFSPKESSEFILDAYLEGSNLCVRGPYAKLIKVPVEDVRALRELNETELKYFEIDADGAYIHWPKKDIHLGWEQLLAIVDKDLQERIAKENADFNRRYGEAIRRCRTRAEIPVDRVRGLTPKELMLIEKGLARASSTALKSLAQAHDLNYDEYLKLLARAVPKPL